MIIRRPVDVKALQPTRNSAYNQYW